MGKGKLVEELRQKVRKKLECVTAQSDEIAQRLREIETKVDGINKEAETAANSLLREKNKDRVRSCYTDVMQQLEHCYNVLFLLNGSLPDDGDEESSESDSEITTDSAAATSTPRREDQPKEKVVPSFVSDISATTGQDLTTCESSFLLGEKSMGTTEKRETRQQQEYNPEDSTLSISPLRFGKERPNLSQIDESSLVYVGSAYEKDETCQSVPLPGASTQVLEGGTPSQCVSLTVETSENFPPEQNITSPASKNCDSRPDCSEPQSSKSHDPRPASPRGQPPKTGDRRPGSPGSQHSKNGSRRSGSPVSQNSKNSGRRPGSSRSQKSRGSGRRPAFSRNRPFVPKEPSPEEDFSSPIPTLPTQLVDPDKGYDVTIEIVETPWLLWIQPFNEDLDDLIDSMSVYHDKLKESDAGSKLPWAPRVGMYVSSLYSASNMWYRALITHIYKLTDETTHEISMVRVFYVDFGNSEDRNVDHLRPLPRRFTKLPVNAIPCALAEVAPSSKKAEWEKHASLAVLMALKTNEGMCLKHAVFNCEPSTQQWFVNVYVPQSAPVVAAPPHSGAIMREMMSVSEHLINQKVARKMDSHNLAQLIKEKGLKSNVSCGPKYTVAESIELTEVIARQSPKESIMKCSGFEGDSSGAGEKEKKTRDKSQNKQRANTKPSVGGATRENQFKESPGQAASCEKQDKGDIGLRLTLPMGKRNLPKRLPDQCGDGRVEGAVGFTSPGTRTLKGQSKGSPNKDWDWKNLGGNWKDNSKQNNSNLNKSQGAAECSKSSSGDQGQERPSSDHQHVRIPPAEIKAAPGDQLAFMMAHIDSPQCFFIHLISSQAHQVYEQLKQDLEQYYSNTNLITMQKYFQSSQLEINDACVARFAEDEQFYRAEVIDTKGEGSSYKVRVRYVDYGNTDWVSLDAVYPIQPKLQTVPAQAICCSLSRIRPIQNKDFVSDTANQTGWLMPAINWFKENTGYEDTLTAVVDSEEIKPNSTDSPLELLVLKEELVNLELVRLGWATTTDLPDMSTLVSPKVPEVSPKPSPPEATDSGMEDWQPMEEDYLSMRNSYQVDTDDAGVALTGYKQVGDKKICRYFAKGLRCWLGKDCPYQHVRPKAGENTDKVAAVVMYDQENLVPLPAVDTWVVVEVISVLDPGHIYVYFPCGPGPVQALQDMSNDEGFTSTCEQLRKMMTTFYDESPFDHQDLTLYAIGEIVAAKFTEDLSWNRCKVTAVDPDNGRVQVFYLDYGNTAWVQERNVKKIDTRFLHVPFQAVECFLPIKPTGDSWSTEAKQKFANFVDGKVLIGYVFERTLTGTLSLDLYDTTHEELNLAQYVESQGYGRACPVPPPVPPPHHPPRDKDRVFMVPG